MFAVSSSRHISHCVVVHKSHHGLLLLSKSIYFLPVDVVTLRWEEWWWWWYVCWHLWTRLLSYVPCVIKQSMAACCGVFNVIEPTGVWPWRVLKNGARIKVVCEFACVTAAINQTRCENPGVIKLIGASGLGRCSQIGRWFTAVSATRGHESRWYEYMRIGVDRFGCADISLGDGI